MKKLLILAAVLLTGNLLADDYVYKTVVIGNQEWMAENVRTTVYNDGTPITNGTDLGEYSTAVDPAYYFVTDISLDTAGYLYTYYAANNEKGICPAGFHIPTDAEFQELERFIGLPEEEIDQEGYRTGGDNPSFKLKADAACWPLGGDDDYGFNALSVGYWNPDGTIHAERSSAEWWMSDALQDRGEDGWLGSQRKLHPGADGAGIYRKHGNMNPMRGFNVRCMRNIEPVDADGNTYETVQINDQIWMTSNLKTTKYNDGSDITDGTSLGDYSDDAIVEPAYYFESEVGIDTAGLFYTYYAANNAKGICPVGFHVPSDAEFQALETFIGLPAEELDQEGYRTGGDNPSFKLKADAACWPLGGDDDYGFNALPSGYWNQDGTIHGIRSSAEWWMSDALVDQGEEDGLGGSQRKLHIAADGAGIYRKHGSMTPKRGLSVRCMRYQAATTATAIERVKEQTYTQLNVSVYPNPTDAMITVKLENFNTIAQVQLYSLQGSLLYSAQPESDQLQISLDGLKTSIYLLNVIDNDNNNRTIKVMKN